MNGDDQNEFETEEELAAAIAAEEQDDNQQGDEPQPEEPVDQEETMTDGGGESEPETETPEATETAEDEPEETTAPEEEVPAEEPVPSEPEDIVEAGLTFYLENMRPRLPVNADAGLQMQKRFHRHVINLLSVGDTQTNLRGLLAVLLKYKDAQFSDMHMFRFLDHKRASSEWVRQFSDLMTLLMTIAKNPDRDMLARQIDVERALARTNSEAVNNTVLQYIGE